MEITDPLLTVRESAEVLQISVPTFWRRVADGTVPKPLKIGSLSRWPRSEIMTVIEHAKALRSNVAQGETMSLQQENPR
jgi:predicted DNA-binding transcriptional regulator AlpA